MAGTRFGRLAVITGAMTLLLAACGAAEPATPRTGAADVEAREIEILMVDNMFRPSTLPVAPGERVRFTLVNQGQAPHTFTLRLGDQEIDVSLAAGESRRTAELTIPRPLSASTVILFKCRWHASSDLKRGMVGRLRLIADEPSQAQDDYSDDAY